MCSLKAELALGVVTRWQEEGAKQLLSSTSNRLEETSNTLVELQGRVAALEAELKEKEHLKYTDEQFAEQFWNAWKACRRCHGHGFPNLVMPYSKVEEAFNADL